MTTRFEKLTFPGSQGASLAGRLELPEGEPRAFALFAHCFTCTKDIFAAGRIAEGLARHGIAVLRFDFTGLGASEGDFAHTNFTSNVEDLVKAADFLRDNYRAPKILIGHSLGGAAVLAVAHRVPEASPRRPIRPMSRTSSPTSARRSRPRARRRCCSWDGRSASGSSFSTTSPARTAPPSWPSSARRC
jgi:alpha/beta superfamily hydrolase